MLVRMLINNNISAAFCFQSTAWISLAAPTHDSKPLSRVMGMAIGVGDADKDVPPVWG